MRSARANGRACAVHTVAHAAGGLYICTAGNGDILSFSGGSGVEVTAAAADSGAACAAYGDYFGIGNGDVFTIGAIASADTRRVIAADCCDTSAGDFDIGAAAGIRSLRSAAANACAANTAGIVLFPYGCDISAGDGDVGGAAVPATTDPCAAAVAGGKNIAAGDGDVADVVVTGCETVFTADARATVAADGYQLAGAGFGADGQIAAVALFHTGVCVSALQGVVQFNVQVDVTAALGSHRRVACALRPCAAGGVDVGVLQSDVGRCPRVRPDGDIVGGGSGRIPVPDDGGGILLGHAALTDVLAAIGGGDGDAAVLQVPGIRHRDGGQKDRNQCQRDEPGQKLSDVHSVASLQREGFVVYKPIITWIGRKCKGINGFISGASAGFPVAKGSHL